MAFDLVRCRDDVGFFEETLELCFAEVGDADCFCLAALESFLHGFPCVNVVGVSCLNLVVFLGHKGVTSGEGGGPVHEVEVKVVRAQVFKRSIKGRLDVVRVVRVVPQLSRDKDFGARDAALLYGCTDRGLSAVDASCINVSVACFQGFCDGVFLSTGILPGSETDGRCGYD